MTGKEIKRKMRQLKIYEKDIEETFIRSSGPGGQNINKVATCVQLLHRPSGVIVKCQTERTQAQNRIQGRGLLVEKVERKREKALREEMYEKEKKKRQERRRSKKSKEKMLENKKIKSEKKQLRKKIDINKYEY